MRYFNYLDNKYELSEGYFICKQIIDDVLNIEQSYLTEEENIIISNLKKELVLLNRELGDSYHTINNEILSDLLNPDVVEYCFKYNRYPEGCSKTGEKINKVFRRIFEIEDVVGRIVAGMWSRMITPFDKIVNGEDFTVIGHSGYGYINLPNSRYYKDSEYDNTSNISCSVFTDKLMNCFNSKIVMLFDINPDSLIAVSSFDSATQKTPSKRSIKNLKEVGDNSFISAGYTMISSCYEAVTKTKSPNILINTMLRNEHELLTGHGIINEAILDKRYSKPKGLLLFSSGYDMLITEYIELLKMQKDYGLDFKVINRSLYRKKYGLQSFDKINTHYFYSTFNKQIDYIMVSNFSYSELETILDGYIKDVLIPLKLTPDMEKYQLEFISKIKEKYKAKQSVYK